MCFFHEKYFHDFFQKRTFINVQFHIYQPFIVFFIKKRVQTIKLLKHFFPVFFSHHNFSKKTYYFAKII